MGQEYGYSASIIDAERKCVRRSVEVERKEILKYCNIKY
jgi:hypothetical protein